MNLPFDLPTWLPWWVPLVILIPILLWLLAFLLVPFSVIGVKSRIDGLEARLDEIHADLRTLVLRTPESVQAVDFDEVYTPPAPPPPPQERIIRRPPIPPPIHQMDETDRPRRADQSAPAQPQRRSRTEPRLDWPR